MTLLSDLLLLFLVAPTVLSEKTRASGKDIIQSRKKMVMVRDDKKGVIEVPPAKPLLACSAVMFAALVWCQAGPGH